jgi:hypothetical protein
LLDGCHGELHSEERKYRGDCRMGEALTRFFEPPSPNSRRGYDDGSPLLGLGEGLGGEGSNAELSFLHGTAGT